MNTDNISVWILLTVCIPYIKNSICTVLQASFRMSVALQRLTYICLWHLTCDLRLYIHFFLTVFLVNFYNFSLPPENHFILSPDSKNSGLTDSGLTRYECKSIPDIPDRILHCYACFDLMNIMNIRTVSVYLYGNYITQI